MTTTTFEQPKNKRMQLGRVAFSYLPLPAKRCLLKLGSPFVHLPTEIVREKVAADGVNCDWLIPKENPGKHVLIYLHGGGFVLPQTPDHLQLGAYLAKRTGMRILMVDYRVAPTHPFPAARNDCVTAYRWLINQGIPASDIVMAGDSAGANLAISALMLLRDSGDALPAAAACLSPVVNLANSGSGNMPHEYRLLQTRTQKFYNASYVGNRDPRNPAISPLFGKWKDLPPMLIHVGQDESLLADAFNMLRLAKSAGVDAHLQIFLKMWHAFQVELALPQARESLDEIALFFDLHLTH